MKTHFQFKYVIFKKEYRKTFIKEQDFEGNLKIPIKTKG